MLSDFFQIDFNSLFRSPSPNDMAKAYFNRLWRKLHVDNFSLLITFYGKHRAGKSLAAVSFAHILDPTFEENLEDRVIYGSKNLIKAVKKVRDENIKGAAFIVDEAGSGDLSSQRWYEEAAKIVSAELQAVGYLNPFIGFVTQNFSFINTTARKLSQGVFEVKRRNTAYTTIKPFWIENNPWISGYYRKYPIFCENRQGIPSNIYKMNRIKLGLPPKPILDRYIAHSQAFKDKLLEDSEKDINAIAIKKNQDSLYIDGIDAIVKAVLKDIPKYKKEGRKKGLLDTNLIRYHFHLRHDDAKLVKSLVEKEILANDTSNPKPKTKKKTKAK